MKRKLIAILLAALLVLALAACGGNGGGNTTNPIAAPAPAGEKLTMGTGGESGTYYAFGGVLANYIGQNSDLSINVVSTGGTAANITGIQNGLYDLSPTSPPMPISAPIPLKETPSATSGSWAPSMPRRCRSSPATPPSPPLPT